MSHNACCVSLRLVCDQQAPGASGDDTRNRFSRYHRRFLHLLLLVVFFFWTGADAMAHSVDEINACFIWDIRPDVVKCKAMMSPPAVMYLVNKSLPEPGTTGWDPNIVDKPRATGYILSAIAVRIDGIPVRPLHATVCFNGSPEDERPDPNTPWYVQFEFSFPIKSAPRRISLTWVDRSVFPAIRTFNANVGATGTSPATNPAISGLIRTGSSGEEFAFTHGEPEHVWHSASVTPRPTAIVTEKIRRGPGTTVMALFAVSAALLISVTLMLRRIGPVFYRISLLTLAVAPGVVAASILLCHSGGGTGIFDPGAAVDRFRSLHQNIYRAFDYNCESDIYDALSHSVAGPALDQIYQDVYQSLILRDQGGAVATVTHVEMLSCGLIPSQESTGLRQYRVRARWRLQGTVAHWGHIHRRTNEYQAIYTVSAVEDTWKISATEMLGQERVRMD